MVGGLLHSMHPCMRALLACRSHSVLAFRWLGLLRLLSMAASALVGGEAARGTFRWAEAGVGRGVHVVPTRLCMTACKGLVHTALCVSALPWVAVCGMLM